MGLPTCIKRELKLSGDFEFAVPVIGYYIKLHLVEELLGLAERTDEVVSTATQLLDKIEGFKQSAEDDAVKQLLENQTKAKTYFLNFALSLYNEQLSKIQQGAINQDLSRALWCCIDLFGAFLGLWGKSEATEDEVQQSQKRIKYCKVYLSKLARGELKPVRPTQENAPDNKDVDSLLSELRKMEGDGEEEGEISQQGEGKTEEEREGPGPETEGKDPEDSNLDPESVNEFIKSLEEDPSLGDPSESKELELRDSQPEQEQERRDTEELIRKMRELDNDAEEQSDTELQSEGEEPKFELPSAPTDIGARPAFIDSDDEPEKVATAPSKVVQQPTHFKPEDLKKMWNREDQISEVQKRAKFAISALNYEDIKSAKEELAKALELLNDIQ